MKILATGGGGQLGRALSRRGALAPPRSELDIADAASVARALDRHAPDLVVNGAAYTAVDRAESEPAAAFAANRDGAAHVAAACAARGIALAHVSTDYVFDGEKAGAYEETDAIAPLGVYGRSKAEGEAAVLERAPAALVVRTSWVFAPDGKNFVSTMLRLGQMGGPLRVVADQHGCPTAADDLARGIVALASVGAPGGIYHYAGDGPTTWHGFAVAIFAEAEALGLMAPVAVNAIGTADYPTPARRPKNSVLATAKVRALGVVPAPWREGLRDLLGAFAQ